jgi:hypothetical protein
MRLAGPFCRSDKLTLILALPAGPTQAEACKLGVKLGKNLEKICTPGVCTYINKRKSVSDTSRSAFDFSKM